MSTAADKPAYCVDSSLDVVWVSGEAWPKSEGLVIPPATTKPMICLDATMRETLAEPVALSFEILSEIDRVSVPVKPDFGV